MIPVVGGVSIFMRHPDSGLTLACATSVAKPARALHCRLRTPSFQRAGRGETMADSGFGQLGELYREMLNQWERTVNELGGQALKSGEFSGTMNKATSVSLKLHQAMGESMAKGLAALNLPSRDDIVALGEQLRVIDERLLRLEAALGTKAADPARPRPPSIRSAGGRFVLGGRPPENPAA
jgi:hypothetical protein